MFSAARPWWTGRKYSWPKISRTFASSRVVGGAAGVRVVGDHHRGLLAVAHRVRAAVREHVQEDVRVLEQERVVPGSRDAREAVVHGDQVELLDDADLVHLERHALALELDVRHSHSS